MATLTARNTKPIFRIVTRATDTDTGDRWTFRFALRSDGAVMRRTVRMVRPNGEVINFSAKYIQFSRINRNDMIGVNASTFMKSVNAYLARSSWSNIESALDIGQWMKVR